MASSIGLAHRGKRWLYLIHRWIGIGACLLFLIWFLSGLVMVYVPFPGLSTAERLAGLPAIDWRKVLIGPAQAVVIASPEAPPRAIALEMMADLPVWRVTPPRGAQITLSAATGERVSVFDANLAARTASAFAHKAAAQVETLDRDQWTVAGSFDAHRPLHRVRLEGIGGHDLYVSSTSGAIVLDTHARERFWNWVGSVPHWIYPTILRQNNGTWRQVVMWVSGPCILVAITGMWIGILRTRVGNRRFRGDRMTPYRGWMLWHHVAGLAGGVTLILWIFSGWLSVDPGRLFYSPGLAADAVAAYAGAAPLPDVDAAQLAAAADVVAKRVEFVWAAGRPWALVHSAAGASALDARSLRPARVDRAQLLEAAAKLVPDAPIAAVELLTAPDAYWYAFAALPQLPVLRIRFQDSAATWVHIDPDTGQLLGTMDQRRRAYRWCYDLIHKWDLNVLTSNRPAWDLLLWSLSLIGIVTSVSGIWIGWRRLRGRSTSSRRARAWADASTSTFR